MNCQELLKKTVSPINPKHSAVSHQLLASLPLVGKSSLSLLCFNSLVENLL